MQTHDTKQFIPKKYIKSNIIYYFIFIYFIIKIMDFFHYKLFYSILF